MTRWLKMVLVALLALNAVPAVAAEPDCAKADTQAALDLCAAKDLKNADRELARIRKQLAKEITEATTRAALDEAQKTWEDYRDAECKFESSGVAGGTAEQMVIALCQTQRAQTRIRVLKRILDCKPDDLTCPQLKH
jgi:uncharacterized protein YecT (DUF1311 family)